MRKCRVNSSERENRLGQPATVHACGRSLIGVLLGRFGYLRGFIDKIGTVAVDADGADVDVDDKDAEEDDDDDEDADDCVKLLLLLLICCC